MAAVTERNRTELRVRVHATPACRVIVPRRPFTCTQMQNVLWHHGGYLVAGGPGELFTFGALFRLAAVSPRTVVFLRLPRSPEPADGQDLHDLVLMRREVPVKPSMWPAIRAQVKGGTPSTVQAPAPRERLTDPGWDWRDRALTVREHAGTVFLSGSARALFATGDELAACAEEARRDRGFRRYGEALVTQFNGSGEVGRRDDDWEIWVLARSRRHQA